MKKALKFLKKGTFITAMFLFITGSLVLSGVDFGNDTESEVATCAIIDPKPDERPLDSPEHD